MRRYLSLSLLLSLLLLSFYALSFPVVVRGRAHDAIQPLTSFTTPLNVSNTPEYDSSQRPRLVYEADSGYLHVVWMEGAVSNLGAAYVRGQGIDWPEWGWICLLQNPAYAHPAIALDSQGGRHVVMTSNQNVPYDIYYIYRPADGVWGTPVNLTEGLGITRTSSFYSNIAVDSQDGIWVVWQMPLSDYNTEIWVRQKPSGEDWEPAQRVTTSNDNDQNPAIAVDSADIPHLVWRNNGTGNWEILYAYYESGNWTVPLNLSATPSLSAFPRLATNEHGDVFVVWEEELDGTADFDILLRRWDGTQWLPWVRVSDSPKALYPAIAAADENLYVVWTDYRDGQTETYFSHSTDRGATWQGDENVSRTGTLSLHPDVAAQSCGRAHVVWADVIPGQLDIFYSQGTITSAGVLLEDVAVAGPEFVQTRATTLYTATYTPITATAPVTLTWDNGAVGSTVAYSWTLPGNYTVTVTATNECGTVRDAMAVEVCEAVESITITGPVVLRVGDTGLYTATTVPMTPTMPVTLIWDNGTVGSSAAYSWPLAGYYTVTVTASNKCSEVSASMGVVVNNYQVYLPMLVRGE